MIKELINKQIEFMKRMGIKQKDIDGVVMSKSGVVCMKSLIEVEKKHRLKETEYMNKKLNNCAYQTSSGECRLDNICKCEEYLSIDDLLNDNQNKKED